jgi:hypothetical protein
VHIVSFLAFLPRCTTLKLAGVQRLRKPRACLPTDTQQTCIYLIGTMKPARFLWPGTTTFTLRTPEDNLSRPAVLVGGAALSPLGAALPAAGRGPRVAGSPEHRTAGPATPWRLHTRAGGCRTRTGGGRAGVQGSGAGPATPGSAQAPSGFGRLFSAREAW